MCRVSQDKQRLHIQDMKTSTLSRVLTRQSGFENVFVNVCKKKMDVTYTDFSLHIIYRKQLSWCAGSSLAVSGEKPNSQTL